MIAFIRRRGTASQAQETPLLRLRALPRLADELGGDGELALKLCWDFIAEWDARLRSLRRAIDGDERATSAAIMCSLHERAETLGARRLALVLSEASATLRRRKTMTLGHVLRDIDAIGDETVRALALEYRRYSAELAGDGTAGASR